MSLRLPLLAAVLAFATGCTTVPEPEPEPTCTDGIRNGSETDIDCGGSCEACDIGAGCLTAADCVDGVCDGGACLAASCDDRVLNGIETDVDCGGGECDTCEAGDACTAPEDCTSGVCDEEVCQAATCRDGVLNGTETDLDCGGPDCGACERGQVCAENDDCAASICFDGTCERVLYVRGTGATVDSSVEVFADQQLIRIDYLSQPVVFDYDGSRLPLPVSDGTFVTESVSDTLERAEVRVAGVDLPGATGRIYFQSISPNFYGMVMGVESSEAANASYNALVVERLDGKEIEIRVIDTSR